MLAKEFVRWIKSLVRIVLHALCEFWNYAFAGFSSFESIQGGVSMILPRHVIQVVFTVCPKLEIWQYMLCLLLFHAISLHPIDENYLIVAIFKASYVLRWFSTVMPAILVMMEKYDTLTPLRLKFCSAKSLHKFHAVTVNKNNSRYLLTSCHSCRNL